MVVRLAFSNQLHKASEMLKILRLRFPRPKRFLMDNADNKGLPTGGVAAPH